MADDHAILSRYATDGDSVALEPLIRKYQPMVQAAAIRQIGDSHLAEDVTQATMMTLMRKAKKIRRQQPLGPWLLRVTHYLAIDAMRATATRRRHEQLAAQQHSEHSYHSCSPWTSLAPVLDSALHALSDSDRTILTLRYLQDWSIEQIAGEFRSTPITVRQRLSRALRRLRKTLSKRGIEKEDLIPALSPLLVKWRFQLHNLWNSVALKSASICIASLMIFTGGFVITRAAIQKSPAPIVTNVNSTPSQGLRAKSTIP